MKQGGQCGRKPDQCIELREKEESKTEYANLRKVFLQNSIFEQLAVATVVGKEAYLFLL